MNFIFGLILILSTLLLVFSNPNGVLSAMLAGGEKALTLTLKMAVVYAVWLGVFELLERAGIANKLANTLRPMNKKLYGKVNKSASDYISLNMSANILGMSGATTPMGIKAIGELEKQKNNNYAIAMFFVINATSIQLIPSSILALRTSFNSTAPASIITPTILTTLLSTVIGVLLVRIFIKKDV